MEWCSFLCCISWLGDKRYLTTRPRIYFSHRTHAMIGQLSGWCSRTAFLSSWFTAPRDLTIPNDTMTIFLTLFLGLHKLQLPFSSSVYGSSTNLELKWKKPRAMAFSALILRSIWSKWCCTCIRASVKLSLDASSSRANTSGYGALSNALSSSSSWYWLNVVRYRVFFFFDELEPSSEHELASSSAFLTSSGSSWVLVSSEGLFSADEKEKIKYCQRKQREWFFCRRYFVLPHWKTPASFFE